MRGSDGRPWRLYISLLVLGALAAAPWGATHALFTAQESVGGNSFSSKADWTAPTVAGSVIQKAAGGTGGYIMPGGEYRVYASVSDSGNPASGTSSVTADVSTLTVGATAVALAAGSWTVDGVAYNYRSGVQTATLALTGGSYSYTVATADAAGNTRTTSGFSVTVDATAPSASDVQTANGGATAGKAEAGDSVTFTFSEPMEPASILGSWSGGATSVVVRITDGLLANDRVTVWNAANTAQLPLGSVDLGGLDYVTATVSFTSSTMTMSGSAVTVTLGTPSGATGTALLGTTMSWTPSSSATDRAGNACSTTARTESGSLDREF